MQKAPDSPQIELNNINSIDSNRAISLNDENDYEQHENYGIHHHGYEPPTLSLSDSFTTAQTSEYHGTITSIPLTLQAIDEGNHINTSSNPPPLIQDADFSGYVWNALKKGNTKTSMLEQNSFMFSRRLRGKNIFI